MAGTWLGDIIKMQIENESIIAAIVSSCVTILLGAYKSMRMLFKLQNKVDEHDKKLDTLEEETKRNFDEMKEQIKEVGDKSAEFHKALHTKIDNIYNYLLQNK